VLIKKFPFQHTKLGTHPREGVTEDNKAYDSGIMICILSPSDQGICDLHQCVLQVGPFEFKNDV